MHGRASNATTNFFHADGSGSHANGVSPSVLGRPVRPERADSAAKFENLAALRARGLRYRDPSAMAEDFRSLPPPCEALRSILRALTHSGHIDQSRLTTPGKGYWPSQAHPEKNSRTNTLEVALFPGCSHRLFKMSQSSNGSTTRVRGSVAVFPALVMASLPQATTKGHVLTREKRKSIKIPDNRWGSFSRANGRSRLSLLSRSQNAAKSLENNETCAFPPRDEVEKNSGRRVRFSKKNRPPLMVYLHY